MQTRRAEALSGFRPASPLHEKETPGEAPGCRGGLAFARHSASYQGPSFSRAVRCDKHPILAPQAPRVGAPERDLKTSRASETPANSPDYAN